MALINKKIISFLIFIILSSCTQSVQQFVDLEPYHTTEPVVSAYFTPDTATTVFFSETTPAFSDAEPNSSIKNASITDLDTNEEFRLEPTGEKGLWQTREFNPQINGKYKLVASGNDPDFSIEAIDSIPAPCEILNVDMAPVEEKNLVNLKIKLPEKMNQAWFEIYLKKKLTEQDSINMDHHDYGAGYKPENLTSTNHLITREDYYPTFRALDPMSQKTLLFQINQEQQTFDIDFLYIPPLTYPPAEEKATLHEHKILVEVRSVSYNYFQYKTSLYKQQHSKMGEFQGMPDPVEVFSNIDSGQGIFGGFSKTEKVTTVKKRTINDPSFSGL